MAEEPAFKPGESVLSFHGPLLYESKILAAEIRPNLSGEQSMLYLNHYKGWNRSWDEWIPADRIKPMNDVNIELQKSLVEIAASKKSGKRTSEKQEKVVEPSSKKRRQVDPPSAEEANAVGTVELKIVIPDNCKILLVNDWHTIVTKKKISVIPASPTITEILDAYNTQVKGTKAKAVANEVCSGLKLYFEHGCGPLLLYKQERPQYDELIGEQEDVQLCTKYGVVHLLRLFVKLPTMMQSAGVGSKGMIYLIKCFQDILRFTSNNYVPESTSDWYQSCSASYEEKVEKS